MDFRKVFEADTQLKEYGSNGLLLFAMMLKFDEVDLRALASECLTDGADDKKIDFVRLDPDQHRVTLAQSYFSRDWNRKSAPANKASDLTIAVSWLLNGDLDEISERNTRLKPKALEIRDALTSGIIESVELLYVHNLKGSENVRKALATCAETTRRLLAEYPNRIEIKFDEVDAVRINEWFLSRERPINVTDQIPIPIEQYVQEQSSGWKAVMTSTQANVFRDLYERYGENLFSANLRGFLGTRGSSRNINENIRRTAEEQPNNFWIYNNGITAITHGLQVSDKGLVLDGMAIINGAQTTGSLHRATSRALENAKVMLRIIVTTDKDLIDNIVRYNNTQNVIYTWELRSGDKTQDRLRKEFEGLEIKYLNRRSFQRSVGDVVPIAAAAQALMAFHGKPLIALKGKTEIFDSDANYSFIFNEHTTAEHIAFVYSLVMAFDELKNDLKARPAHELLETDKKKLEYMTHISFKQFLVFCIGLSIQNILGRKVPDKQRLQFVHSRGGLGSLANKWSAIIPIVVDGVDASVSSLGELHTTLKSDDRMSRLAEQVRSFVTSVRNYTPDKFETFAKSVKG